MMEIEKLKVSYLGRINEIKAVDRVSIQIREGEALGIVGESGCGKSTLALSVLMLIRAPTSVSGKILFRGRNLLECSEREMASIRGREIAMVFQDPMTFLNPTMKVIDQISESVHLYEGDKTEVRARTNELLQMVYLSPDQLAKLYPHELSGGMLQRAMIAMALAHRPSILILDEPTTALDVTIERQILTLLKELHQKFKMSILLITHNLGIICDLCERVYVMYAGKIVEVGDIYAIFENPLHPYLKGLLDSVLSIDEFKKTLVTIQGVVPDMANPPSGCRFHPRCKYAQERCKQTEPTLMGTSDMEHFVACWLYRGRGNA